MGGIPVADPPQPSIDPDKPPPGSTVIETDDEGNVTVKVISDEPPPYISTGFDENLACHPQLEGALGDMAEEVLDGVQSDLMSRQGWEDNYARGLPLLALKIEQASRTKAQKRNVSQVSDTTMLESIVKGQAIAKGQLLPAAGPAKIMTVPGVGPEEKALADDFQTDLNLALTKGMKEYIPDFDRGLFGFFYGGNMFREGYHHPFKRRPAVATIATEDLIVSEEATCLDTATRVTVRIPAMTPSEVKRRQLHGIWRKCDLSGQIPDKDAIQQVKEEIAGLQWQSLRPKDEPLCFYRTIQDFDLSIYGFKEKGVPDGLPVPYRVTVEKYSRQVVHIERYWKEGDPNFGRKERIIHYEMVPGFGFLAYGFLQLQGNQTQALTAAIRLLLDAMMFGVFPGGMKVKGGRSETNEIEPGPGEFVEVGIPANFDDIRKAIMAMPYKDLNAVAVQLYELLQKGAERIGAAAMVQGGEARSNVPVGTIMAMIEEKSVVMSAVHKRLFEGMGRELSMIRELFMEDPGSLGRVVPNPKRTWNVLEEFSDLNLVPVADPNIPSHMHRLMLATAVATLMSMPAFTGQMDVKQGLIDVLRTIGWSSPETLVPPPQPQPGGPDPAAQAMQAESQAKMAGTQQKEQDSQRKAAQQMVQAQQKERDAERQSQDKDKQISSQERIAVMKEQTQRERDQLEARKAAHDLALQHTELGMEHAHHQQDQQMAAHQNAQQQQNTDLDRQERTGFGGETL